MTEACGHLECNIARVDDELRSARAARERSEVVAEAKHDLMLWGYIRPTTLDQMKAVGRGVIEGALIGLPVAILIRLAAGWM